jgi:nucleoside-diphosphate kinase
MQYTLAIIKPDAFAAGHVGEIITMIERNGFHIEAMGLAQLDREHAEEFYQEHKARPFFGELVEFMTSGPIVVMALAKENAVADWRNLMGSTNPAQAAEGTIRKLFGTSVGNNAVHGSDSEESAERELGLFFDGFCDEEFEIIEEDMEIED